jgi:hypothetical protein
MKHPVSNHTKALGKRVARLTSRHPSTVKKRCSRLGIPAGLDLG